MKTAGLMLWMAGALMAQVDRIQLIVQSDDMGAAHAVNTGTIRAFKEGIVRVTNVIAPGPWFLEAATMLQDNPGLDVGVHLAITSEWSGLKWRPLTSAPSLVDADGNFFPMVWPNKNLPSGTSLKEASPRIEEIERELRAQIELARRHIPRVSYFSTHMGFSGLTPAIGPILEKLAKEYGLVYSIRGDELKPLPIQYSRKDSGSARAEKLAKVLEGIGPGKWIMVEHAAEDTPESRAMGHPGYEDVAADRQAVMEAWIHPSVKEVVKRRNIDLSTYPRMFGK
jgi:hypothetical protein